MREDNENERDPAEEDKRRAAVDIEDKRPENTNLEPVDRLNRDLKEAARNFDRYSAKFLVSKYYEVQDRRIRTAGQIRSVVDRLVRRLAGSNERAAVSANSKVRPLDQLNLLRLRSRAAQSFDLDDLDGVVAAKQTPSVLRELSHRSGIEMETLFDAMKGRTKKEESEDEVEDPTEDENGKEDTDIDRLIKYLGKHEWTGRGEPLSFMWYMLKQERRMENNAKIALGEFAGNYAVGAWMQSIYGIGPVLSAAMLAHFDIRKAPTVGHMWRFAGLDPTLIWLGRIRAKALIDDLWKRFGDNNFEEKASLISKASGQHVHNIMRVFHQGFTTKKKTAKGRDGLVTWLSRKPWNGPLKDICVFRLGEVMVKFSNRDPCFYGQLFALKKKALADQNERLDFKAEADRKIAEGKIGKTTATYGHLKRGMLAPGQIHNRARRWMVKLFLSHMHRIMHLNFHGAEPPAPFVFEHVDGNHRHVIEAPNWPGEFRGKNLKDLVE